MRPNAVPNKMHKIRQHATWMLGNILHHLSDTHCTESRRPIHLRETRFLHCRRVVNNDDVVVAQGKVGLSNVGWWIEMATTAETVNYHLRGVLWIEMAFIEWFGVEHVQLLPMFLCAARIQEEVNLRMWASEWLLEARCTIVGILFLGGLTWNWGEEVRSFEFM